MEDSFKQAFTPASTQETRLRRLERGAQTLRGGTTLSPSGGYGRIPLGLLDEKGKIPISNSSLTKVGSVPPAAANPGFAYVGTDTTIHIYWDGTNASNRIVIYRADGSRIAIPPGDILVTGLTADTTYYFLPFWNTDGNHCSIGFVPGTVGGWSQDSVYGYHRYCSLAATDPPDQRTAKYWICERENGYWRGWSYWRGWHWLCHAGDRY